MVCKNKLFKRVNIELCFCEKIMILFLKFVVLNLIVMYISHRDDINICVKDSNIKKIKTCFSFSFVCNTSLMLCNIIIKLYRTGTYFITLLQTMKKCKTIQGSNVKSKYLIESGNNRVAKIELIMSNYVAVLIYKNCEMSFTNNSLLNNSFTNKNERIKYVKITYPIYVYKRLLKQLKFVYVLFWILPILFLALDKLYLGFCLYRFIVCMYDTVHLNSDLRPNFGNLLITSYFIRSISGYNNCLNRCFHNILYMYLHMLHDVCKKYLLAYTEETYKIEKYSQYFIRLYLELHVFVGFAVSVRFKEHIDHFYLVLSKETLVQSKFITFCYKVFILQLSFTKYAIVTTYIFYISQANTHCHFRTIIFPLFTDVNVILDEKK